MNEPSVTLTPLIPLLALFRISGNLLGMITNESAPALLD